MSTTPTNSIAYPVFGQAYNFGGVIKALSTGNALTGGLTGLAATISKNDGAPVAATNTPLEIGSGTGLFSLDLTATEMSFQKLVVTVTATNSGAIYSYNPINPVNLSPFNGRFDAQTPIRFEQLWLDLFAGMALNGANQNGAQLQLLNPDGSVHFASSVTQNATSGTRSKAV
jgi:hypothetical protein